MKQFLLGLCFLFIGLTAFGQSKASIPSDGVKLENPKTHVSLKLFPNPAADFFSISEVSADIQSIKIYNQVAREVKKFNFHNGEKYNISDLPKGIYLVQFYSDKNKVITTIRLAKK